MLSNVVLWMVLLSFAQTLTFILLCDIRSFLFHIGAGYGATQWQCRSLSNAIVLASYMWPLMIGQCVLYMCTHVLCWSDLLYHSWLSGRWSLCLTAPHLVYTVHSGCNTLGDEVNFCSHGNSHAEEWRNSTALPRSGRHVKKAWVHPSLLTMCRMQRNRELYNSVFVGPERGKKSRIPTETDRQNVCATGGDVNQPFQSGSRLITVSRFKFNSRVWQSSENVAMFISELRQLATKCDFGNSLEKMLRDRIVTGVNDPNIQRRLLTESNLTLKKATEIAQALETSFSSITCAMNYVYNTTVVKYHCPYFYWYMHFLWIQTFNKYLELSVLTTHCTAKENILGGGLGWSAPMLTSPQHALELCTMCISHAEMPEACLIPSPTCFVCTHDVLYACACVFVVHACVDLHPCSVHMLIYVCVLEMYLHNVYFMQWHVFV